jgi:heme oxygenase
MRADDAAHGPRRTRTARPGTFGAIVDRVIDTAEAEAEVIAGARDTFARLITWLAR